MVLGGVVKFEAFPVNGCERTGEVVEREYTEMVKRWV